MKSPGQLLLRIPASTRLRSTIQESYQRTKTPKAISTMPPYGSRPRLKYAGRPKLATLDESKVEEDFSSSGSDSFCPDEDDASVTLGEVESSPTKTKNSRSSKNKKQSLSKQIKDLQESASRLAEIGDEEEALKYFLKATMVAGSGVAKINTKIRKVRDKPPATHKSVVEKLQKDLMRVLVIRGTVGTEMALLHERQGDYDRAITSCRETLEVLQHQTLDEEIQEDVQQKEELCRDMVGMIERLQHAKACLQGRQCLLTKMHKQIGETADPEEKKILYERFEEMATTVVNLDANSLGETHLQVTDTLQFLSTIVLEQNKPFVAVEYLQKALEICKATLGMKHPRTGQYFLRIARIYRDQGQDGLALKNFSSAADVLKQSKKAPGVMGSVLNDIAVVHMRRSELDLAVSVLREALGHYKSEAAEKDNGHVSVEVLKVYWNLGDCYMQQKSNENAKDAYANALEIQRGARKLYDVVGSLDLGVLGIDKKLLPLVDDEKTFDTLGRLAKASAAAGYHREALGFYKEALIVVKRVSLQKELSGSVSDEEITATRDQLCRVLYCIAESSKTLGSHEDARQAYGESIQLTRFLDTASEASVLSAIHCAKCFVGIGDIHLAKQEYAAARKQYTDAFAYCEKRGVPKAHELFCLIAQKLEETVKCLVADAKQRQVQLTVLEQRTEGEMSRSEHDKALSLLTKTLSLQSASLMQLKAQGKETSEQVCAVAISFQKLGSIYLEKGDDQTAERAYIEAKKLFKESGAGECGLAV